MIDPTLHHILFGLVYGVDEVVHGPAIGIAKAASGEVGCVEFVIAGDQDDRSSQLVGYV